MSFFKGTSSVIAAPGNLSTNGIDSSVEGRLDVELASTRIELGGTHVPPKA